MSNIQTNTVGLYSVKDVHIGMYLPPFLASSDDDAKRIVTDAIEPGSVLARFPADFHLVRVGAFNSKVGISHHDDDLLPLVICSVTDIVRESVLNQSSSVVMSASDDSKEVALDE